MKLLIIGPEKRTSTIISIIDYAQEKFENVMYVPIEGIRIEKNDTVEVFYKNINLTDFDVVLPLIKKKYAEIGFLLLKIFKERKLYTPISYDALFYSTHETLVPMLLESHGLKYPKTYITLSKKALERVIEEELDYPVSIKVSGHKKRVNIDNENSLKSIIDTMQTLSQNIIIQKMPDGVKISVLKLFNDLYALKDGEKYTLDKKEKDYVKTISNIFNSKILNVDFVRCDNGDFVAINIDAVPNITSFISVYGEKVVKSYINPLFKEEEALLTPVIKRLFERLNKIPRKLDIVKHENKPQEEDE